ncbi:MAG: hypothetical protein RL204_632 [Bacteroidota bacterium]|jgi:flagellar biosynthesis protein FlhB
MYYYLACAFRFIFGIIVIALFEYLLTWPFNLFIEWFFNLETLWMFLLGFLLVVVAGVLIGMTAMLNGWAVSFSPLPVISTILICFNSLYSNGHSIYALKGVLDWGQTRIAVLGVYLILVFILRGIYGCLGTLMGLDEQSNWFWNYRNSKLRTKHPKNSNKLDVLDSK